MKRFIALAALLIGLRVACRSSAPTETSARPVRVATFNIEDFPKDDRQIQGAFDELVSLDAQVIGVQEIMNPLAFERAMRDRLGDHWGVQFEPFVELGYRHTGVLYDRRRFEWITTTTHDETKLGGDHKRVLDVRLRPLDGGPALHVLVVHLKAGGDARDRGIRARQHAELQQIVKSVQGESTRVVVLGDFNATDDDGDRSDLAALASTTNLAWSTEPLACSAFWRREDGCPRSRLDHVLAWEPGAVSVAGACATDGCNYEDRCPLYSREISDHCPVVVDLAWQSDR